VPDTAPGWTAGRTLTYPGGTGLADSEGVTLTDAGSAGGVFVSSERNLAEPGKSRISILRYDVSSPPPPEAGANIAATHEWNLTTNLPGVAANAGAESVEWVPDSHLVGFGFFDENTNATYNPATYPNHGTGLFFVGLEGNGIVYAYALITPPSNDDPTSFTRVATLASGFLTFGALHFDSASDQLWVVCDNNCNNRARPFAINTAAGATKGRFVNLADHDKPAGLPDLNHEGFTMAPAEECVGGNKPIFWVADDTGSNVLRGSTIPCTPPRTADFNGDGFADLAVGVPDEDVGAVANAGAVNVIYGSAAGLAGAGGQWAVRDEEQLGAVGGEVRVGVAPPAREGRDLGRAPAGAVPARHQRRVVRERRVRPTEVRRPLVRRERDEEVPCRRGEYADAEELRPGRRVGAGA